MSEKVHKITIKYIKAWLKYFWKETVLVYTFYYLEFFNLQWVK